jgi:hypothetical protein
MFCEAFGEYEAVALADGFIPASDGSGFRGKVGPVKNAAHISSVISSARSRFIPALTAQFCKFARVKSSRMPFIVI